MYILQDLISEMCGPLSFFGHGTLLLLLHHHSTMYEWHMYMHTIFTFQADNVNVLFPCWNLQEGRFLHMWE